MTGFPWNRQQIYRSISTQIIIFLSAQTGLWFKAKSPLNLDVDLIVLSRELILQGTIN